MINEFRPQQQIRYRDTDGTLLEHECFQLGIRGTLTIEAGPQEVKVRRRAPNGKVQVLTYSAMGVTLGEEPPEVVQESAPAVAQAQASADGGWMAKRGVKR